MSTTIEFNRNEDKINMLVSHMKQKAEKAHEGGGKKKIEAQHAAGKLTARERIDYLLDKD